MGYQWNFDPGRSICKTINSDTSNGADALRAHLAANNFRCHVEETTIVMDEPANWIEVLRASEPFIGVRLTN